MKYVLLFSTIFVLMLMLWIAQSEMNTEFFDTSFCPDPRFTNFNDKGCTDTRDIYHCEQSKKNGFVPQANLCKGMATGSDDTSLCCDSGTAPSNFEHFQSSSFCPDPRFKNFDKTGCRDKNNLYTCKQSLNPGRRDDETLCEGVLPTKFCPDIKYYEFKFEGCSNPKSVATCKATSDPKYSPDEDLCKNKVPTGFCPDPRFKEFDAKDPITNEQMSGCINKQSKKACLNSVKDGYLGSMNKCLNKKPIPFCANDKFVEFEDSVNKVCKGDAKCRVECSDPSNKQKCNEYISLTKCNRDTDCIVACSNPKTQATCDDLKKLNEKRKSGGYEVNNLVACKTEKIPVCANYNLMNFQQGACSDHGDCSNTMNKKFRSDPSKCGERLVATEFCPDPQYQEFNAKGCAMPSNVDACENTVNYGYSSNRTKCNSLKTNKFPFMNISDQVQVPRVAGVPIPGQINDGRPSWANVHA
jgi:hypothetical protein